MIVMDQNTILTALKEFKQGNKRRFLAPEYDNPLYPLSFIRQLFGRINGQIPTVAWFDHLAMQSPVDHMAYMECMMVTKPKIFIETGTLAGECTLFFADVLRRIHGPNNFRIITIELDPNHIGVNLKNYLADKNDGSNDSNDSNGSNNESNSEIISLIGDSTDPKIVSEVYRLVDSFQKEGLQNVAVTLDSNHTAEHVAKELASYSDLVSSGQYLIVQDTFLGYYCGTEPLDYVESPLAAVETFLSLDNRFEIDVFPQRWIITQCPFGFLKRK